MVSFYGSIEAADDYATAVGSSNWAALSEDAKRAALVRGSAYVDSYAKRWIDDRCWLTFLGGKTGGWAQEREWPRSGIDGLPDNVIPVQIEYATYEAAIREGTNPGSLSPDFDRTSLVKSEKVDVLQVTYAVSDNANAGSLLPVIPAIESLLSAFLVRRCTGGLAIYTV